MASSSIQIITQLILIIIFLPLFLPQSLYSKDITKGQIIGKNIIINPDVEKEYNGLPYGWQTITHKGNPIFKWDSKEARSGKRSLKIQGPGAGCWFTKAPVKKGKKYIIYFWFKASSKSEYNFEANIYASVWAINADGSRRIIQWINDFKLRNYKQWTQARIIAYIPKDGDQDVVLELWLNGNRSEVSFTDNSSVWFDDISIEEFDCPMVENPKYLIFKNQFLSIWQAHALDRVFQDDPGPENALKEGKILIHAARGERESYQLVVRPENPGEKISWEWGDFTGPSKISKNNIECHRVDYIRMPPPMGDLSYLKDFVRSEMLPDPLPIERIAELEEKKNNPFLFVINIPYNIKTGIYNNTLIFLRQGRVAAEIPLELKIWNFSIPRIPSFEMHADLWPNIIFHYERGDEKEILKKYLYNIAYHRGITPAGSFDFKIVANRYRLKEISIDFKSFEDLIAFQKELGWCNYLEIHWSNFKLHHGFGVPIFKDPSNEEFNPEFVHLFKELLGQVNACLERKGCYSSFKVQVGDEPNIMDNKVVNYYKNIAKLFKSIDFNIRLHSTGNFCYDFYPYYDRWYFNNIRIPFSMQEISFLKKHKSVGIYVNNMTSPYFPPIKYRLLLWALWKDKYEGIFWWQINGWGRNIVISDRQGKKIVTFKKNDPWKGIHQGISFIYPPREGRKEYGPINSLRWEALREGMEDVEYLNILEGLIKNLKGVIESDKLERAQKTLSRVCELVSHVPVGGRVDSDHFHTYDTMLLDKVRAEIAASIEELLASQNNIINRLQK